MKWLKKLLGTEKNQHPPPPPDPRLIDERKAIQGEQTIIFLYIPKTAGATLRQMIDQNYHPSRIYNVLQKTNTSPAALAALPEAEKRKIQLIYGHFYFGLHESLPQPNTYLTLLRDPINRVLSHYFYVLKTPMHHLHQRVVSQNMSLEDYINSGMTDELDNGQVRMLSGIAEVPIGQCTNDMLLKAQQNLEKHFTAVGLTERFEESMRLLEATYKWKRGAVQNMNVNRKRKTKDEIPPHVLRKVHSMNELDMELYRFVEKTFGPKLDQFR